MENALEDKKTVGKEAYDRLLKPDPKQGIIDTQREMNKKFLPEVEKCIKNHKDWTAPYYVLVINKREKLMVNVMRQYFTARQSLPTPDYDQTVFKYVPSSGELKYLWTVPDKETVDYIVKNDTLLPDDHAQLLHFCKLFKENTLDKVYGE